MFTPNTQKEKHFILQYVEGICFSIKYFANNITEFFQKPAANLTREDSDILSLTVKSDGFSGLYFVKNMFYILLQKTIYFRKYRLHKFCHYLWLESIFYTF